jgi:hypothetical protein
MPIDYKKYSPDWLDIIRPDILRRAGYKCEFCKVKHKAYGYRLIDGSFVELDKSDKMYVEKLGHKFIRIILTISHKNHDIKDNDYSNLQALCQKCHINYDKDFRALKRKSKKKSIN